MNTATPWQRTGAYEIVALVRAGQVARARALADLMIQQDYYGGFGAEADAPGLGIWTLAEVAAELNDSAYDRRIWGAVQRKAAAIEQFLDTRDTIRALVPNPIVPRYRSRENIDVVAVPSRNGLVVGRMDHGYPLLYVNAVSYLGLQEAASLAQRIGERTRAEALRRRAGTLRQAWLAAYAGEEKRNPRTFATALWPSGVIDTGDGRARLLAALAEHRAPPGIRRASRASGRSGPTSTSPRRISGSGWDGRTPRGPPCAGTGSTRRRRAVHLVGGQGGGQQLLPVGPGARLGQSDRW